MEKLTTVEDCSYFLKEEIANMLHKSQPVFQNHLGKIFSQMAVNIYGFAELSASPYYSLTLDTGTPREPFVLPLTLIDSAKYISQWITVVGKRIRIHKLLIVSEQFEDKNEKLPYTNIVVEWGDIEIIKNNPRKELLDSNEHYSYSGQNNDKFPLKSDPNSTISGFIRVLVHHVSMPFHIDKPPTYCLLYVSYINRKNLERKLWLVLKADQVSWREFLVPNREYLIKFPTGTDMEYLDKFQKPLENIFVRLNRELNVVFHHRSIFHTLLGCELPNGSRIFLTTNTEFSNFVVSFVKDPFVSWFSASEADNADVNLVSFYGQVDSVTYDKDLPNTSCYLCKSAKPSKPTIKEPQYLHGHLWMNPWKSTLSSIHNDEPLELPSAKEDSSFMRKGVPGKLVQAIKLRDLDTGDEQIVYLKHSYIYNTLKLYCITRGMVLCITHLIRRKSKYGKYYFTTTIFSSFKVLSYNVKENFREGWGSYSFFPEQIDSRSKIWGTLESFHLTKIAITAKCSYCKAVAYKHICSNMCSAPKQFTTSAYAIGWIQIVCNKTISVEKVFIKDHCVQKLLSMPENIWKALMETAAEEEIVCFPNYQQLCNPVFSLNIKELLEMYCNVSTSKGKCYISVKKLHTSADKESFYLCIDLEPVNKSRLRKVADFVRKTYSM